MVAGFGAIYALSTDLESARPPLPAGYLDSDLALQGGRLRGFAAGAEGLIADWYWMMSLQYVGNKLAESGESFVNVDDLRALDPRLLYPYLDTATDLDPHFMAAYYYGAIVLPAVDPQQAITLTQKGMARNPDQWRLHQYLGYIYWRMGDYEKASEVYQAGSRIPGVPPFMKMMAAAMKTQGGSRETARQMYGQMLQQSEEQSTIDTARLRLMELDSLDERDALNAALEKARAASGRCPATLREIVPMLRTVKLPHSEFRLDPSGNLADPSGAPYILEKAACKAVLDPERTKVPLR
jgi:tetratricopeptide (TPR) repeat protein